MSETKEITIDGVVYVPKGSDLVKAESMDGMEYVICRTYSAGVFAGYLEKRTGQEVVLRQARRLWYWDGSASLSELAMKGVSKPQNCKFPCEVDKVELMQVIEIIPCTKIAKDSIDKVKEWTAH